MLPMLPRQRLQVACRRKTAIMGLNDVLLNEQTLADIRRWAAMEKQAVVKPGVTPDLEPAEKTASDRTEEEEIERLESQDPVVKMSRVCRKSTSL